MYALARNPLLNRRDLHVTCIEYAPRAVLWGVDLWTRIGLRLPVRDFKLPRGVKANWTMSFRNVDATALPADILNAHHDVVIDWMMLHGLPRDQTAGYFKTINRLAPRFFVVKCCSKEGSSLKKLRRSVPKVIKRQWSQAELVEAVGPRYRIFGEPRQCRENLRMNDGDGPRTAKREYCFRRV